jgi:hypothetical protein
MKEEEEQRLEISQQIKTYLFYFTAPSFCQYLFFFLSFSFHQLDHKQLSQLNRARELID